MKFMVVAFALLAVAGCGKKVRQPTSEQQSQPAAAAPSQSGGLSSLFSSCPSVTPDKAALQKAIKAATIATYGADGAATPFTVSSIATTDCRHMTFAYHVSGTAPQTVPVVYDDGKWQLTFYGKPYPVP
jgi:hypothetical protein